jgi:isopentenyldiphosphate isomerase
VSEDVLIPIVDINDNLIGYKYRSALVDGDIGRITCLWVMNDQGKVLLAQRSFTKKKDPGLWSSAVAGTVEQGETYESNIKKEAEEEIGLVGAELKPLYKFYYSSRKPFICMIFYAVVNQPIDYFRRQVDEVEKLAWVPYDHLKTDFKLNAHLYVPSFPSLMTEIKSLYPEK